MLLINDFWAFVNERHATYLRKKLIEKKVLWEEDPDYKYALELAKAPGEAIGWPTSFTDDPILKQFRFCNVFRELDRVTVWINENIRKPYADHPNLWLMLAIARTINWPDTLQHLFDKGAMPVEDDWVPSDLTSELEIWQGYGNKVYTGAYMIRAESNPKAKWYSWSKNRYISEIVIGRLWKQRKMFQSYLDSGTATLRETWETFQEPYYIGWGPFMAYQVVVDLRHTRYLKDAPDIETWSALGPGSRRGLNRLYGRPVDYPLKQDDGLEEMLRISRNQDQFKAPWVPHIELSDIQNCLCEFDKYQRVKNGEGRPRAQYVPGRGY